MEGITVNGFDIAPAVIAAEIQNHPAASPDASRTDAVRALVVRELLLQEARRLGIAPVPMADEDGRHETDDDALIRQLLDDQLTVPKAGEESCRRYYENNANKFRSPDIFEAAHILLSASPADKEAYEAAVGEAKAIISVVTDNPKLFADIARQRSDCSSAKDGGCLGQVTRGQTLPEFETFLFALEEGQLSSVPVKTRYGIHVLRLDRRMAGRTLPFDLVKTKIAAFLAEASWRLAVSQYIKILAGRAEIKGVDLVGAESPLVQ
jgi:peptidyl-prolyl cis-trans isomerase C